MTLNTYLNFGGNCREAFEFYRSVFGGEFSFAETFGNGPPDMGVSEADKDLIMHMSLPVGSTVCSWAATCLPGSEGRLLWATTSPSAT